MRQKLRYFTVFEMMLIALMASLGIATKSIIVPLIHMITGPLYIPGGSLAGGFYMMWLILGAGFINKKGTATLIALVQGVMVMVMGFYGSHGALSIISYTLPGIMIDIFLLLFKGQCRSLGACFFACILANITGTFMSNLLFFRLPIIPLLFSISLAAFSGGIGGYIAYFLINRFRAYEIIESE
ncbi:ECF transporter S component [Vallitalea okinawensis]|uniref:ECF transporter S component n=1 Tax=Vallitalea okinawensis TaxID=2078660 RepID=UPI000CFD0681|nr:ECF transporter S component [Vallitalea okinawensis]